MCGIVGVTAFERQILGVEDDIRSATAVMAHRGPGGEGFFHRDQVWLGHRYLPIVDPPHGFQPMHRGDRLTVVFNGELYNAAELRTELKGLGHSFETLTDTEVLLAAYEAWGSDCLRRLRGMFAFAMVDWHAGQMLLARDPLGIKPLVYCMTQGSLAFASEIQALRQIRSVRADSAVDEVALDDYLRLLYIPPPRTIFRNIRKLPPAHALIVDLRSGRAELRRYWQAGFQPDESRSEAEWQEAAEAVLADSIRAHMGADVKVGALLSGGVDSTLVAMEMARLSGGGLDTFTTGFSDNTNRDERSHAMSVARSLGAAHHETMVPARIMEVLPSAVRVCGEPFGDSSLLCAWELCRFAKERVGVVLTGDGGDEFFGGYPLYREWQRREAWSGGPHPVWKRMLQPALHWLRPLRYPPLTLEGEVDARLWAECVEYFPPSLRHQLWRSDLWRAEFDAKAPEQISACFARHPGLKGINRAQMCDIEIYLPGDILPKMDAASMAHGLEARTPMVDVRVAEFAATIPPHILASGDPSQASTWTGKRPLKNWMARHMPDVLVNRPKQGFTAPLKQWLVEDAQAHDRLRSALDSAESPLRQWFQPQALSSVLHGQQLHLQWQMLFLAVWADEVM